MSTFSLGEAIVLQQYAVSKRPGAWDRSLYVGKARRLAEASIPADETRTILCFPQALRKPRRKAARYVRLAHVPRVTFG